jgi:hypothetical protein
VIEAPHQAVVSGRNQLDYRACGSHAAASTASGSHSGANAPVRSILPIHRAAKLAALRARRDNACVGRALDNLRRAAEGTENTMPYILDAVRAYATLGEMCDALRAVFGSYEETAHL